MKILDLGRLSFAALLINKARSVLTMLGIIIGIGSVILMLGVGQSAQQYLLSQVASFGSDLIFVGNGQGDEKAGGPPSAGIKESLTAKDFKDLAALPWIAGSNADVMTNDLLSYG
ncbi:ABC transporter permease, partial [Patescibacteria group bacterium]|nr:ABC transporter permease [Patescibacteria group bacterium]